MFYLLVLYVAPRETRWDDFFVNLQRFGVVKNKPKHDRGSLRWFRVSTRLLESSSPAAADSASR